MARPDDWGWISRSRPYALRRAFNVCIERNVYESPSGQIGSRQMEEQYPIVGEAVDLAEKELWASDISWTEEDRYRRYLGNRADWLARDICNKHQGPISEAASAPRGYLPAGWRLDVEAACKKLSLLQQRIICLRYSRWPRWLTHQEVTDKLKRSGEVDEKGQPIPLWRVVQERSRANASLERSLGADWERYALLYCNLDESETED